MATAQKVLEKQINMESMIASRLNDFEMRMKALGSTDKKSDLSALASDFAGFKDMVLSVLRLLQEQVASLACQVDEIDCQSRRNALVFTGVKEQDDEVPAATISGIIVTKMGFAEFDQSMIHHCIRIGAKNPKRPRPILVRLVSISAKASVWGRKKQLKSSGMVVSEFLTKSRQDNYARARRHFGMNACWSMNGAVFVKLPDNTRVQIVSAAQLDELCRKHPAVAPATSTAARTPADKPATKAGKITPTASAGAAAPATRSKTGASSKDRRV